MTDYFKYYAQTYRVEDAPDGGQRGYLLNTRTGEFEENNAIIPEVMFARAGDISYIGEAEFIDRTEVERQRYFDGDGPIFALYQTIEGLYDQAESEGRPITPQELALVKALRRRTFAMWDEDFARRDAGEPMQNEYQKRQFGAEASSE
ncbi:hypothetical protein [Kibdelosporangium phytohabitans]|uniref:Uncharacterized protein n=1 Tax=Kibdelosporangium phytohabitans TaxID=860235 RepID=A0A0N7F5D2_9PSEU|nr:hypothetical protein [Kibdelosporangium phytohabitans]ALG13903.1 hypothetical protein AOZ06_49820 [Kibdelosporangium phytohabitans]MBE1467161.1 hypothetical protein [Kibdelosporangium phytohabitans]